VSRIYLNDFGRFGSEQVLAEGWCQVFPSHSIGDLVFDSRGKLLISGGEGASYTDADIGQIGSPPDACGDPPDEGGSLRAQDVLTDGDPAGLDGTIARIDPDTGGPAPGNGIAGEGQNLRVAAYGLRNPFRFTIRPGTDELWIGDVGWTRKEEINRAYIGDTPDFGWPCYEGANPNETYAALGSGICNRMYDHPGFATAPWYSYDHSEPVTRGDHCGGDGISAISGLAFDESGSFPRRYAGALFFADTVRECIWSFRAGGDGVPKLSTLRAFEAPAHSPVDLVSAKGGLYYPSIADGTIRRIAYVGGHGRRPSASGRPGS
jgi:glucose/arabinose dehydrogenase